MLRVLTLTNRMMEWHLQLRALEASLVAQAIPFYWSVEPGVWSWRRKVEWEIEWAAKYPNDHFCFIDAFDQLFVGTRPELETLVAEKPLIFGCDCGPHPWPDKTLVEQYDKRRKRETPWCWLNGCGPTGLGSAIQEAGEWGVKNLPSSVMDQPWGRSNDQLFWTLVYLAGFGELDQQCRIHQVLYDMDNPGPGNDEWVTPHLVHKDGRIINTVTGSKPQFLHATGKTWKAIPEELWRHLVA